MIKHVTVVAGGTTLGQLLIALSSPMITRLYSLEHLGRLPAFVTILLLILSLESSRYEIAVFLPKQARAALQIFSVDLSGE